MLAGLSKLYCTKKVDFVWFSRNFNEKIINPLQYWVPNRFYIFLILKRRTPNINPVFSYRHSFVLTSNLRSLIRICLHSDWVFGTFYCCCAAIFGSKNILAKNTRRKKNTSILTVDVRYCKGWLIKCGEKVRYVNDNFHLFYQD